MDESQLHDATLDQLNKAKMLMTSPDWDAMMRAAAPAQQEKAQAALLRLEQTCLSLENAELQDIADKLKANEPALIAGQKAVQSACDQVCNVQSVMKAVTSLVNAAVKVIALA